MITVKELNQADSNLVTWPLNNQNFRVAKFQNGVVASKISSHRLINQLTERGELVIDPFLCTEKTAITARKLGRDVLGVSTDLMFAGKVAWKVYGIQNDCYAHITNNYATEVDYKAALHTLYGYQKAKQASLVIFQPPTGDINWFSGTFLYQQFLQSFFDNILKSVNNVLPHLKVGGHFVLDVPDKQLAGKVLNYVLSFPDLALRSREKSGAFILEKVR
jgi:hypothetical protein